MENNNNNNIENKEKIVTNALVKRVSENGEINLTNLTEEEKAKYNRLNSCLVVKDINSVSSFGSDLQTSMTKYSNDFLNAVRTSKCGEIGTLVDNLLTELGYVELDDFEDISSIKKFLSRIPILRNLVKSVEKIMKKYDSIAQNVDEISKKITAMRMLALRDNNALQVMFDNNILYGQQIEELIIAGKIKIEELESSIQDMEQNPDKYTATEIQDTQVFKNNLERRLNDMFTLRYVIKQSLPQIRTVQYNNLSVADKAQSIISTTIPVWRNQLSIAVALNNQKNNIDAQKKISDTTNQILLKNSELLKQNSVYVAKESERSVVDVETLRTTTASLIETLKEVQAIHEEATKNRKATEEEIIKVEKELKSAMTAMVK